MNLILLSLLSLLSFLVTMVMSQTQTQEPTPTQILTRTPTTTPMGSPMFTYSLTFPNSDPATAVRSDNLEYLIKAIACSSNSPIELVYISYVRANGNIVPFTQKRHTTTGLIRDCSAAALAASARGLQVAATTNMLVGIYYLAPRAANPANPLFQPYASVISSAAVAAAAAAALLGNSSGSSTGSSSGQDQSPSPSLSTGGIVGIALGLVAATLLVAGAYALYANRRQDRPVKTLPTSSPKLAWMSSPISVR